VIIPVRNRADHRLRNALATLRQQKYPRHLINIEVVDYGSNQDAVIKLEALCQRFEAQLTKLPARGVWNKSKCANYAIKRCQSEFILSADADNIFPENFIAEMVRVLRRTPLSVVYSQMLDLEEEALPILIQISEDNLDVPYRDLEQIGLARGAGDKHPGTFGLSTFLLQYIRGYDEEYEEWGWEDNDLMTRFLRLGLDLVSISDRARFLHQWHPKGEGVADWVASRDRNKKYFEQTTTIIRNKVKWGEG
jgi:glycosyltransferase involved in cell wall biosynthesis